MAECVRSHSVQSMEMRKHTLRQAAWGSAPNTALRSQNNGPYRAERESDVMQAHPECLMDPIADEESIQKGIPSVWAARTKEQWRTAGRTEPDAVMDLFWL